MNVDAHTILLTCGGIIVAAVVAIIAIAIILTIVDALAPLVILVITVAVFGLAIAAAGYFLYWLVTGRHTE